MKKLKYGNSVIEYELEYRGRKTMAIEVHPSLMVKVVAPKNTDAQLIEEKLLKRAQWIKKQQRFFDQFLPSIPVRNYVAGETHYYMGRGYPLKLQSGKEKEVKLKNGDFNIYSPDLHPVVIRAILAAWYYDHAIVKFNEAFEWAVNQMRHLDIGSPSFEIRKMRNRWGSCTPQGQIFLNPDLIRAPFRSVVYVCLHELCHLIEPNHNKSFFALQETLMPDWSRWKDKLEQYAY